MSSNYHQLIETLLSNDNTARQHAEEMYKSIQKENPRQLVVELVQLIAQDPVDQVRALSAVLLKRYFLSSSNKWSQIDAGMRNTVKQELLKVVGTEAVSNIRHKIGQAISELAACITRIENGSWNELLPAVVALTQHTDLSQRETALDILKWLAEDAPQLLQSRHKDLFTLYSTMLADPKVNVQVAALKATTALLLILPHAEITSFQSLTPQILKIIELLLNAGDELSARESLEALVDVAVVHPTFLRPHLQAFGQAMVYIASREALDSGTRELGLEILLSIAESAGGMVRKSNWLVQALVPLAMQMICELPEDEDWCKKYDSPETFTEFGDDDDESLSEAGTAAIDRIARSLGGKAVLPVASPIIKSMLSDSAWQKRRAALITLCFLGEGCKHQMQNILSEVVEMAIKHCSDPHERVRHAAIHCLGQLAEDFGEIEHGKNFQAQFHSSVVQVFVQSIHSNAQIPRIQALAASAIINFCNPNNCRSSQMMPYLKSVLESLFELLRQNNREVQEQAITAVACVARVVDTHFGDYYNIFMPIALELLQNAVGPQNALLRGKAMETIALIGQSVRRDAFQADAHKVMQMLLHFQQSALQGTESSYFVQACARIGSVLKEDFLPYVPVVLPPVLQLASQEPDAVLTDVTEEHDEQEHEGDIHSIVVTVEGVGKQQLSINTSCLEEKTNACNMLYQYALDLEGAFAPYVEEILNVLLPLLEFQYSETVRYVASLALSRLLYCVVDAPQYPANAELISSKGGINMYCQSVFDRIIRPLLNAFQKEEDTEAIGALGEAISCCLQFSFEAEGAFGIPNHMLSQVLQVFADMGKHTTQSMMARKYDNSFDEDFDEAMAEQQEEDDELELAALTSIIDSIGWLIKLHKGELLPLLNEHVVPILGQMINCALVPSIRGQAICTMDDIIEHCGATADPLLPTFIPCILQAITDDTASVRQAAAYGVGVCASQAGSYFDSFCQEALQSLVHVIMKEEYRETTEDLAALDNAISAVGKLCVHRPSVVNASQILPVWLTWLPLRSDLIEAREVHGRLVDLVEAGKTELLGENFLHISAILKAFANILILQQQEENEWDTTEEIDSVIEEESKEKLFHVLGQLKSQVPQSLFQTAWTELSPEQQAIFMS